MLLVNPIKDKNKLAWEANTTLEELIAMMVEIDLKKYIGNLLRLQGNLKSVCKKLKNNKNLYRDQKTIKTVMIDSL